MSKILGIWTSKVLSSKQVVFLIALATLTLLSRIPSFLEPWWYGDENIYMAVGQAIARNRWLYLEAWDNKPPLIYLIYAASYLIFGNVLWPLRVLNAVLAVVQVLTFYLVLKQHFALPAKAAIWPTSLLAVILATGFEGTIFNAENIFTPLIWLGFWIIYRQLNHWLSSQPVSWWQLTLGALSWSLAAFTKVQAILEVAMLGLLMLIVFCQQHLAQRQSIWSFWKNRFLWQFFGVIAVLILVPYVGLFLIYAIIGEVPTLTFSLFGFGGEYIRSGKNPIIFGVSLTFVSGVVVRAILLLTTLAVTTLLFFRKQVSAHWLIALNWLAISIFASLLSERNYPHYLLQMLPILLLLAALTVRFLTQTTVAITFRLTAGIAAVLILQTFLTTFTGGHFVWSYYSPVVYSPRHYFRGFLQVLVGRRTLQDWQAVYNQELIYSQPPLTRQIQKLTSYHDTIFVVANRPDIYVVSERLNGHRFVADYHFAQDQVPEIYQALLANGVALVLVDHKSDKASPFLARLPDDYLLHSRYQERYSLWLKK